jgi:hypothetical protein
MLRRQFLQTASLAAAAMSSVSDVALAQATDPSRTLVVYFSRTGNTRVIAQQIRRAKDATLFEINPAAPYPEDYEETVAQASRETAVAITRPWRRPSPTSDHTM